MRICRTENRDRVGCQDTGSTEKTTSITTELRHTHIYRETRYSTDSKILHVAILNIDVEFMLVKLKVERITGKQLLGEGLLAK